MKNLIAGGFLFVGGGIFLEYKTLGIPSLFWCSLCFDWCRNADYFVFSDDGKYG